MSDTEHPGQALLDVQAGVATLTLDNPKRKNAITQGMARQIDEFCKRVSSDESIGALVIRGAGNYFCSGADTRDLGSTSQHPASDASVQSTSAVYQSFVRVGSLPVPTISVVIGGAVGAGLNMALATDAMVTTPTAIFDSGFLARGIHPGGGHISLLGRSVGQSLAASMALFGHPIDGRQAEDLGWALHCGAEETLDDFVSRLVAKAAADPKLVRRIKTSVQLELGPPAISWQQAVEVERGVQMWSLGRKGAEGWDSKPAKPTVDRTA